MTDRERMALEAKYAEALRDYLANGKEEALHTAYEMGRRAIGEGLGILDLIGMHQEATILILKDRKESAACVDAVDAAGRFLSEHLSPLEMTHRGFQEAVAGLRRLNEMLEEEAKRIAHALHDDAGQLLVAVHLALQEVSEGLPAKSRERLKKIREPLDEIEKQLRRLSHELRPTVLDDLGLVPALEFLVSGITARTGVPITIEGQRSPRLPALIEVGLYRIAQEAVRNAIKHGAAKRIDIRLVKNHDKIRCSIKDNGRGFDVAAVLGQKGDRGLGLIGMRERTSALGGQLGIDSTPGRGSEIRITIPLGEHNAHSSPSRG